MMLRPSAMLLFSVSTRWARRSRASGARAGQPGPDARGVQLGRGQQRAELVVQVARQPVAFVFARGLQVVGQLGELRGAAPHLDVQLVTLGLHGVLERELLVLERGGLAQVQEQGQQAQQAQDRRRRCDLSASVW